MLLNAHIIYLFVNGYLKHKVSMNSIQNVKYISSRKDTKNWCHKLNDHYSNIVEHLIQTTLS